LFKSTIKPLTINPLTFLLACRLRRTDIITKLYLDWTMRIS